LPAITSGAAYVSEPQAVSIALPGLKLLLNPKSSNFTSIELESKMFSGFICYEVR